MKSNKTNRFSFFKFLLAIPILFVVYSMILFDGFYPLSNNTTVEVEPNKGPYSSIGSYIINLDRSVERYQYISPQVTALGFPTERISAVDGKSIPDVLKYLNPKKYFKYRGHQPQVGTVGCYLSHINAWKQFLESSYEFAVIFEDDVSFDPVALRNTIELLQQNKGLWDITSFEISHRGNPFTVKKLDKYNLSVYLFPVTHAGVYIINRKAATQLLRKALPITMPVDQYFNRGWELDLIFVGIEPRIAFQTYGDSEIQPSEVVKSNEEMAIWDRWDKIIFQVKTHMMWFLYNVKLYITLKWQG